jgi:prephenate dehydrogenase
VIGYDPDSAISERALELGAVEFVAADVATAVAGAEAVFVAAPVGALPEAVAAALAAAGEDCVVSDVGSTKRVVQAAGSDRRFIGGHPLAGAETSGVEHAREDLFDGATWYLTPVEGGTTGLLYERLHRLLASFGARPAAIDPETHDRLMARVSHLPHVLANLLVAQASDLLAAGGGEGSVPAVGPSFRDATRVAGANTAIWTDIYVSNRDALVGAIDELASALGDVRSWLAQADAGKLADWNDGARAERTALLGLGADGTALRELRVLVPNRPGVVAGIALELGRAGINIADLAVAPSADNSMGSLSLWVGDGRADAAAELIGGLGYRVAPA